MQIDHLRYFIALEQCKSINKTSRTLHTTPQNVSRILKNLENEMQTDLFFRTADGITLTQAGIHFLQFAKTTIYQLDRLQTNIIFQKAKKNQRSEVTIFSTNVINEIIFNDILVAFAHEYPDIIVNNILVDWKEGYKKIVQTPSSLAFLLYLPEENILEGFDIVPAIQAHNVAIMSKNHPLAQNNHLFFKQLVGHKLIVLTRENLHDTELIQLLEQFHIPEQDMLITVSGSLSSCYRMAATGEYICPGSPESFVRQDEKLRQHLVAIPVIDVPTSTHAMIKPNDLPPDSAQNLFFTFVLDYLQKRRSQ